MAGRIAGAQCPPSPAWEGAGADSPTCRDPGPLPTCPHGDVVPAAIRAPAGLPGLAKETRRRGKSSPTVSSLQH